MTTTKNRQTRLKFPWSREPQGLVEFKSVLEFLRFPALLVDRNKGLIWGVNEAFLLISNYSRTELEGSRAGNVFAGIDEKDLPVVENEDVVLLRKMQDSLPVVLRSRGIEGNTQLFWLFVEVINKDEDQLKRINQALNQAMVKISGMSIDLEYSQAVQSIAATISKVFDPHALCIYQADATAPRLKKLAGVGAESIFPEYVSSTNLIRLSKTHLWQPGKRLATELHQAGKNSGMKFVGTTPLGQAGRLFGLLAVADTNEPSEHLNHMLDILGTQVTHYFEGYILAENLREEVVRLRQSMMAFQVVMENAHEGILIVDPNLEILAINPAIEWMLGYADWEVKGKKIESMLIGPESLIPALEAAYKGIPTHNIGNVSLHRRDGHLFPAHIQTIPVSNEQNVTGLVVLVSDISENEEIRTRSQQLEQRAILGEVTAVFAHEVRNPINNIYSGLQLMAATTPPDDPAQDNLTRLQNDCVRLNHLMESVLNFSRNTQYKFEAVDLELLLRRMIDRWQPRFSKISVNAFFQIAKETPKVQADPRALEQVFTNLISNAVDAMSKKGGNLAVRVGPKTLMPNRKHVSVTVSDDGPGIPDEIRDRIFEPFVTTKSNGTGLGLAITKRILTAHHGSIQINSFPGGTMFEVTLLAHNGDEI